MTWPASVITRQISFGKAVVLETGDDLRLTVSTTANRSLVSLGGGFRMESLVAMYEATESGEEVMFPLPVTNQEGWADADSRLALEVGGDKHSHLYTTTLTVYKGQSKLKTYTVGPYAVPQGAGVIDGDTMLVTDVTSGVTVTIPEAWQEIIDSANAVVTDLDGAMASHVGTNGQFDAVLSAAIAEEVEGIDPPAFQTAVENAAAGLGLMTFKRLTTSDPLIFNNLETGVYQITLAAVATALGLPGDGMHGVLTVQRWTTSYGKIGWAIFETTDQPSKSWSYTWARSAGSPSEGWQPLDPDLTGMVRATRLVHTAENPLVFNDLGTGIYQITRSVDADALGLPSSQGRLTVDRWTIGSGENVGMATYVTRSASLPEMWVYIWWSAAESQTNVWRKITGSSGTTSEANMALRHVVVRDRHAAAINAPISVATATPVAIVWDDWIALMLSYQIIEMHQARNLPITIALPSRIFQEPYATELGGVGATAADVNALIALGGVEIANHSATHRSTPVVSLYDEIVTSQAELRAMFPSQDVNTWVMPTVMNWPGFPGPGATDDEWASEAGQLILGHHAFATGKLPEMANYRAYPMTGTPIQGADRIWVEAADLTEASRKNLTERHYGTKNGAIISAHANNIGKPGRWDLAGVEAYLDYLVVERDAGRIKPMLLSEWAWAKSSNPA